MLVPPSMPVPPRGLRGKRMLLDVIKKPRPKAASVKNEAGEANAGSSQHAGSSQGSAWQANASNGESK